MNKSGIFLLITGNKYPDGDAGALRQHAFALVLKQLGYNPVILGMGETTNFQESVYDGIRFYSLRYTSSTLFFRILGRLLFSHNIKKILKKTDCNSISGILMVSGSEATFKSMEKISAEFNIPIYYDCVEWYSPEEFSRGKKSAEYKHNIRVNEKIINKKYRVFAISSYLKEYFDSRSIPAIRVPVIMDVEASPHLKQNTEKDILRFQYAGAMGRKDNIEVFVSSLNNLSDNERSRIRFDVFGTDYESFRKMYGDIDSIILESSVFFHGRVPRNVVLDSLEKADFTVLFRPADARYAKAGFPTKVVESLTSGTPVFCNLTSDLSLYLIDGINSCLADNCSVEACTSALRKALSYTREELDQMKVQARQCAESNFDYRNYVDIFKNFVK